MFYNELKCCFPVINLHIGELAMFIITYTGALKEEIIDEFDAN